MILIPIQGQSNCSCGFHKALSRAEMVVSRQLSKGVIIYVAVLYLMANKLNEQAKFASKFSYIFIAVVGL